MKKSLALVAFAAGMAFAANAAQKIAPDTVVLENGNDKVTARDFDAAMTRFPEDLREEARAQPDTILKMLDALYVNRVLARRAVEKGALKDPLVTTRLEQLKEAYLAQKYLDDFDKAYKLPNLEQRAREIYLVDPKKYSDPPMVSLSHIVVSLWGRTPEMGKQRALEARAELQAGKPWAEVAAKYSDDPNVRRHRGDLGLVKQTDLEPVIAEALDKMKQGDVSEPLVSRTGVHLVRLDGRKAAVVVVAVREVKYAVRDDMHYERENLEKIYKMKAKPLDTIGEGGFWLPANKQLTFRKGKLIASVTFATPKNQTEIDTAQLARVIENKLPK